MDHSIIAFLRRSHDPKDALLFCCNFTPEPHHNYRFGVPASGYYREIFSSDSEMFGGSNLGNASSQRGPVTDGEAATRSRIALSVKAPAS